MGEGDVGLLRVVGFLEDLGEVIWKQRVKVEAGEPIWWNSEMSAKSDLYTVMLSAVVLAALKSMFLSFAEYHFLSSMKYKVKRKLFENAFYTMFYVLSSIFGLYTLSKEEWRFSPFSNSSEEMFLALFDPTPPQMSNLFKAYYATQMGYYIGLVVTVFMDTRRSDFAQYLTHHVTTLSLMTISILFGLTRVGLVILILHDVCDIFLHGAKTVHYCKFTGVDTAFFAIFAVCFFLLRLVIYPRIVWSVATETLRYCVKDPSINQWPAYFDIYVPLQQFSVFLLVVLYIVNCFWMALIWRLIVREVTGSGKIGQDGDVRSDDED